MSIELLAIGAHPDDIELSCGATVAKLVRSGSRVIILDLTEGELGTRGSSTIRRREASEAAKILGVDERLNLSLPDGGIEVNRQNILSVVKIIRFLRPTILLIPHESERHPDHEHTHRICKEAWFYAGLEKIRTSYRGKRQDAFRPHRYFHYIQKYEPVPSFVVDVTINYEVKEQALAAFASQFYNPKSKESETLLSSKHFLESIRARDAHWGSLINVPFGEAFFSLQPIGLESPLIIR